MWFYSMNHDCSVGRLASLEQAPRASTTSTRERERERESPSTTDARAEQKNVKAAGGGAFGDKGFGAKARWLRAKALVKEEDVEREVM